MKQHKIFYLLYFLVFLSLPLFSQSVNIGFVVDGIIEDENSQKMQLKFKREIQKTLGASHPAVFNEKNILSSEWNVNTARQHYQELSQRCDLIFVLGAVSLKAVIELNDFIKPTIALGVYNTEVQNIPFTKFGTSGVENFSYVMSAKDMDAELEQFHKMTEFKNIVLLFDENIAPAFDVERAESKVNQISSKFGFKIHLMYIGKDSKTTFKELSSAIDAVYLGMIYETGLDRITDIADYLKRKKIPSFSLNRRDVDLGIMASLSAENDFEQIMRKMAVMADGVINGENLADMKVAINQKEELYINRKTVRKIDFKLPIKTLFTAKFVESDSTLFENVYGIEEILKKNLEENLSIKLSYNENELSEQEFRQAYANFLPKIDVSASGVLIDENRASPMSGQAEKTITGGGTVQQLLYSEEAVANVKIRKWLHDARSFATKQQILDVTMDSYSAYFSILQAKTNIKIQRENLSLSRKNLELARLKSSIGAAGNADVYRWESEVANASQFLVEAHSNLMMSKLILNNQLNGVLSEEFDIKDASIESDMFIDFSAGKFGKFMQNSDDLKLIVKFLIEEAKIANPTRNQLLINLKVADRQQQMYERLYYTPTVALQGQLDEVLWRGGKASDLSPEPESTSWNVALQLSYPLFSGNSRYINLQKSKIQQKKLDIQLAEFDNSLALNIKTKAMALLKATTNIDFSNISAKNAVKSLELVQNAYKQGATSLTALLDAQQAAIRAKSAYSNSVYNYLVGFLELEASVGYFHILVSKEEQASFYNRLNRFVKENN